MSLRNRLRVESDSKVNLQKIDPSWTHKYNSPEEAKPKLAAHLKKLTYLQTMLYAENKQSLLIVLQGMDTAGKDGVLRHVLSCVNPQGCSVARFNPPSVEEAGHDFLWRVHAKTPRHGQITVFNRSHYEDVLIVRVHNLVPETVWSERFAKINNFENLLADESKTTILKFFLHISKEEQLKRFHDRLVDPAKNWKISEADYSERNFWDEYQKVYEDMLSHTSTKQAPWFIVPADNKWFRDLAIAEIIKKTLEEMDMKTPAPAVDLDDIRRRYHLATTK